MINLLEFCTKKREILSEGSCSARMGNILSTESLKLASLSLVIFHLIFKRRKVASITRLIGRSICLSVLNTLWK